MARPDARLDVELRLGLKGIAYGGLVVIGPVETAGIHVYQHDAPISFSSGRHALRRS